MTLKQVMAELKSQGDERLRALNIKHGIGENNFGMKMCDISANAKNIKEDHALAMELWPTENLKARLLATLILNVKSLSESEMGAMVRSVPYPPHMVPSQLVDWLVSYVVKSHPEKEVLRQMWMKDSDAMALRAGWSLTSDLVAKGDDDANPEALLKRIGKELGNASPPPAQWTMNICLAQIGIYVPSLRDQTLAIGQQFGLYRDYPVSKGCTYPLDAFF